MWWDPVSGENPLSSLQTAVVLLYHHMQRVEREKASSPNKGINPLMKSPTSWHNCLPKALPSSITVLGVETSTYEFHRDTNIDYIGWQICSLYLIIRNTLITDAHWEQRTIVNKTVMSSWPRAETLLSQAEPENWGLIASDIWKKCPIRLHGQYILLKHRVKHFYLAP